MWPAPDHRGLHKYWYWQSQWVSISTHGISPADKATGYENWIHSPYQRWTLFSVSLLFIPSLNSGHYSQFYHISKYSQMLLEVYKLNGNSPVLLSEERHQVCLICLLVYHIPHLCFQSQSACQAIIIRARPGWSARDKPWGTQSPGLQGTFLYSRSTR